MSCDGTHRRGGKKEKKTRAALAATPECRRLLAKVYSCTPLSEDEFEIMRRIYGGEEISNMINDAVDMAEAGTLAIGDVQT